MFKTLASKAIFTSSKYSYGIIIVILSMSAATNSYSHDLKEATNFGSTADQQIVIKYVVDATKMWGKNHFSVCLGPDTESINLAEQLGLLDEIREALDDWMLDTEIEFDTNFLQSCFVQPADVRINVGLAPNKPISNAVLGRGGLTSKYNVVLRFPQEHKNKAQREYLIRHEIGHFLAFHHEHQWAECGFDEDELKLQGIDRTDVEILQHLSESPYRSDEPDITSIMLYNDFTNPNLFLNGKSSPCYRKKNVIRLSEKDHIGAASAYSSTAVATRQKVRSAVLARASDEKMLSPQLVSWLAIEPGEKIDGIYTLGSETQIKIQELHNLPKKDFAAALVELSQIVEE